MEMNIEVLEGYKEAEAELNEVYQRLIQDYADDTLFLNALSISQSNWTTFRDAELNMKYPELNAGLNGSIQSMCSILYMTQLTNDRMIKLEEWIDGVEEGDVCIGSTRFKR